MLVAVWMLLVPGVLAVQPGPSRLVPWPSWLGTWLAEDGGHPEDTQCARDSRMVMEHFANNTVWAARILDASSAGPSPGMLRGVTDNLGDFDECLGLHWPLAAAAPVEPQYCLVTMRTQPFRLSPSAGSSAWATAEHVDPYADVHAMIKGQGQHRGVVPLGRLRFGVCLPASCPAGAVARAAQRHLTAQPDQDLRWAMEVEHPHLCTQRQHVAEGSRARMVFAGVLAFIGLLVVVGTCLDPFGVADLKKSSGLHKLSAFSLRRHWSGLTQPMQEGAIAGLAGYKTYMCIVVVVFHHFLVQEAFSVGANSFAAAADGSPPALLMWLQDCIHNGMVHFFFFSGFLMVRAGHKASLLAPLHRAVRFLPLLATMVLVQAFLLPAWSSGPAWRWRMEFERDDCKAAWWRTLLYINNFGPRGAPTCVIQLWSMAVDFQCFAVCQLAMWAWAQWQRRSSKAAQVTEGDQTSVPNRSRAWTNMWSRGELSGAILALCLTVIFRLGMAAYYEWPFVLSMDHFSCAHLENATELFRPYTPASIHLLTYVAGGVVAILVKPLYRKPDQAIISKNAGNVAFGVVILLMVYRGVLAYEAWRDAVHYGPVLDALAATCRQLLSCAMAAAHVILLEPRIAQPNMWQKYAGSQLLVSLHRLTPLVFLVHMFPAMTTIFSARGPVDQATMSLTSDATTLVVQSFLSALVIQLAVLGPLTSLWTVWARSESKPSRANGAKLHSN